ncbi:hypothetical protein IMSAG013_00742 [Clostridiales bacterium]|nr:hypothetical protein IMSAG013_00742 [Clostridiales bacterium]
MPPAPYDWNGRIYFSDFLCKTDSIRNLITGYCADANAYAGCVYCAEYGGRLVDSTVNDEGVVLGRIQLRRQRQNGQGQSPVKRVGILFTG